MPVFLIARISYECFKALGQVHIDRSLSGQRASNLRTNPASEGSMHA